MKPESPTYVIELRPMSAGWRAPGIVRLRWALKTLLRGFGLRCVSIAEKAEIAKAESRNRLPLTEAAVGDLFEAMRRTVDGTSNLELPTLNLERGLS